MIWQLIKRDSVWRALVPAAIVVFALLAAAGAFVPPTPSAPSREAMRAAFAPVAAVTLGWVIFTAVAVQSQFAGYHSGLPISGRDIWLSRVLVLLALIWLPALAGGAFGLPLALLLEASAVYTALILAGKCSHIRELHGSRRLWTIAFRLLVPFGFAAPFLPRWLKSAGWFTPPSPLVIFGISMPASAALFYWGWTNVPKSFQLAPPESQPAPARTTGKRLAFAWSPVLSSIGSLPFLILFSFLFVFMAKGNFGIGVLAAVALISVAGRCRWLLALPFPARKLFAMIAVPAAVATVAACIGSAYFNASRSLEPRARLIELAAELAGVFLTVFLSEFPAWRRLSRLPPWSRWIPFALTFVAVPFAFSNPEVFRQLAAELPAPWWQLTPILALPVLASYWLAEKAFMEREYRPLYIETHNLGRSAGLA